MGSRRVVVMVVAIATLISASGVGKGGASEENPDNIRQLTTIVGLREATKASVWDAAFQGDLIVVAADGNDPDKPDAAEGAVLLRILKDKPYLERISFYRCRGNYGDIAVWGKYAFIAVPAVAESGPSLEAPNDQETSRCNNTNGSIGQAGVRIVDISDPRRARQVGFVATRCGANRLALLPSHGELIIYGSFDCPEDLPTPVAGGYGTMIVICFDPSDPPAARACSKADIAPLLGCIDVTVHVRRKLAACVDQEQFALLDLSDPHNPIVGEPVRLPNLLFSGAFTWDGQYLAVTEGGINTAGQRCGDGQANPRVRFFNVEDITDPVEVGSWAMHRTAPPPCFASTVGMVPTRDGSYLATVAMGSGGVSVIDFTQPSDPLETAHFAWPDHSVYNAYWYNGRIYAMRGSTESVVDDAGHSLVTVLKMRSTGQKYVHFFKKRFNPQTLIEDFR